MEIVIGSSGKVNICMTPKICNTCMLYAKFSIHAGTIFSVNKYDLQS